MKNSILLLAFPLCTLIAAGDHAKDEYTLSKEYTVTIDGVPVVIKWGEHFFPAAPGTHEVRVSFKYIFGDMGENGVTVQVGPGRTPRVNYRSPFIVFSKGKIAVAP